MDELYAEDIIKIFETDPEEGLDIGVTLARNVRAICEEIGIDNLDIMHKNYYLLCILMTYMYDNYITVDTTEETLH